MCNHSNTFSDTSGLRFISSEVSTNNEQSVINSLDCPEGATDLSSCSFNTTSSGNCASHYYDAVVVCFNGKFLGRLVKVQEVLIMCMIL